MTVGIVAALVAIVPLAVFDVAARCMGTTVAVVMTVGLVVADVDLHPGATMEVDMAG